MGLELNTKDRGKKIICKNHSEKAVSFSAESLENLLLEDLYHQIVVHTFLINLTPCERGVFDFDT